ncbi:ABC transporter substrate binding protein [Inhella sp.]|uniref:ABC transporter substrate binding protein n=1 Tax=Inhella sp. TaxID=1921806 RepID=UPI0035B23255
MPNSAPPPCPGLRRRDGLLRAALLLGTGGSGGTGAAWAADAPVSVIYPDIGEPFRSVFSKIVEGIDERLAVRSDKLLVPVQSDASAQTGLAAELQRRRPRVVVALGRAGLRVALALEAGVDVVGGGIISPAEGDQRATSLHSLTPDPQLLLQRLRALLPGVRRVTVVYSGRHSGWLMRPAQDAARALGLELRALEVDDLKQALRAYQDFFGQAGAQDALWLPQDPATVDEATVLPLVLQECWDRNIALFSSNLAHVRRGALFSLFPNNLELGRSLGQTATALLARSASAPRGLRALREVQAALNTRTASHLGLDLNPQLQRGYDLLLPER